MPKRFPPLAHWRDVALPGNERASLPGQYILETENRLSYDSRPFRFFLVQGQEV